MLRDDALHLDQNAVSLLRRDPAISLRLRDDLLEGLEFLRRQLVASRQPAKTSRRFLIPLDSRLVVLSLEHRRCRACGFERNSNRLDAATAGQPQGRAEQSVS